MRHFLKETDFARAEAAGIFTSARLLKKQRGKHAQLLALKLIHQTHGQRIIGTNNCESDSIFLREPDQPAEVVRFNGNVLAESFSASVARCAKDRFRRC